MQFMSVFIGLLMSVSISAEPLLKGRVRLSSGQPVADAQVRLFDLADLRHSVSATTDEVTAGDAEPSKQVRVQGSLSPSSALLNRKQSLEQP